MKNSLRLAKKEINVISTKEIKFCAIGKIVFQSLDKWNIPRLHFMVSKDGPKQFQSICLESMVMAEGKTIEESIKNLVKNISDAISEILQRNKGKDILDIFLEPSGTHLMDDYWREYRQCEIDLAKNGKDIGTATDRHLVKAIREEFAESFRELIKSLAHNALDDILDNAITNFAHAYNNFVDIEYYEIAA